MKLFGFCKSILIVLEMQTLSRGFICDLFISLGNLIFLGNASSKQVPIWNFFLIKQKFLD